MNMLSKSKRTRDQKVEFPLAVKNFALSTNNKLHKFSDYLQRKTNHLSTNTKRVYLFLFCLLFGSTSVCVCIKAITNKENTLKIHPIAVSGFSSEINDEIIAEEPVITQKEMMHIEEFKNYMDSLKQSDTGKYLYDSIISARPHLIDSILFLEKMYQIQSSKK